MVGVVLIVRKILSSSNGCKLMNYAHRFDNSRKFLCFQRFLKQRNFSAQPKGFFLRNKRNMPRKTAAPATLVKKNGISDSLKGRV